MLLRKITNVIVLDNCRITYQPVDGPADKIETFNSEHDVLPLGVEHNTRLRLTPRQVVIVRTVVDRVSGLGGGRGRQSRACELVTVLT